MMDFLYHYSAKVVNVVDGDTVDLEIDLGMWIKIFRRVRLLGIDTPEIRGTFASVEGETAKDFVAGKVFKKQVMIKTKLDSGDKYGRLLGEIYYCLVVDSVGTWVNLNQELLSLGLARKY